MTFLLTNKYENNTYTSRSRHICDKNQKALKISSEKEEDLHLKNLGIPDLGLESPGEAS